MKDHILHLHPHDDFASARDKIDWAQAERVVLVWPERGHPLREKLDLVLLKRHAARLGAKLGFVTADPEVGDVAAELGIPVFGSIEASHLERWIYRRPTRLTPPPGEPARVRAGPPNAEVDAPLLQWPDWAYVLALRLEPVAHVSLFLLALASLVALAFVVLPSASITLIPASRPISLPVEITADPAQAETDSAARIIPARVIEVKVQSSASAATSGLQDQPNTKAAGAVIFTNRRTGPVTIPTGTVVRTTGGRTARFVTTQSAVTPTEANGTVSVPIEAVDAGPAGNVGAEQINAIDGSIAFQLAVVNADPTSGGAVLTVASVTEADQAALRETVLARVKGQALAALAGQLGENEFLAPDTLRVVGAPSETFSHFVGEKADVLTLDMRATLAATAVNERGAQTVALAALNDAAAARQGMALIPGSETFERDMTIPARSDAGGRVTFSISAAGRVAPVIDAGRVRQAARRQLIAAARARLADEYDLAAPPQIDVWPQWLGRLPWLGTKIKVQVRTQ